MKNPDKFILDRIAANKAVTVYVCAVYWWSSDVSVVECSVSCPNSGLSPVMAKGQFRDMRARGFGELPTEEKR